MSTNYYNSREGVSGDFKCVVFNEPWSDSVKVYLMNTKSREIATIDKDGIIRFEEIEQGADSNNKPLFTMSYFAWQSILQALGSIEPDDKQAENNGRLKATQYHLEDLRHLLKLDQLPFNVKK
jgi:hypothetical protein